MHVGNDVRFDRSLTVEGDTSLENGLSVTGDVNVQGGVTSSAPMNAPAFNQTSDYRLKERISPLVNALDCIMKLKPSKYVIGEQLGAGLIAHELQEIIPEAVLGSKDGEFYQRVNYIQLIAYLISALQEQQKQIRELQEKFNDTR
jgi:hypothetical protein